MPNRTPLRGRGTVALRITALTTLAVTAVALTGCAASEPAGPTEITFSYLWTGNDAEALEAVIADFNASQSDIKVVGVSSPDFQKQLTSMSSSNGSFDISDNFGNGVGSWAAKGILAPLDELLADNGVDIDDFAPAAMDQMRYDGKIYSLPISVHTQELLYNKTLLAEAGIEPPTTMDEFAAAIEKLTQVDADGNITRVGLGVPDTATLFTTLSYAFGGTYDGADHKTPTPDDPKNVAALDWYVDNVVTKFGADKLATFRSGLGEYMSPQDQFYTGKAAMVIDGEWQAVNIPKTAPELDWGVVPIPAASPELANATMVGTSTLFIPSNSKHKAEAATFLAYLVSDKAMAAFTSAQGNLPGKTTLLDDPAYAGIANFDVWLQALASPNAQSLASQPYSAQYSADLGAAFDDVIRGLASPPDALASVAAKTSSYDAG